ncbi:MAG: serine hydrolase domain-containing protein [Acidimicrobiia bacterium]
MAPTGTKSKEIDALLTRAQREIESGLLPGCQVAIARHGELELFEAFGEATTEDRFVVFSATKAFVASAVWILIGEGLVDEQQLVTEYIPEFGSNGKETITVEQVMLHTSGFPHAPLGPPKWFTREGRIEQFAHWRLNWEPDSTYEYHATSAHWVLAEIIDRVTGGDYCDVIETRVTGPAGLPRRVLGAPLEEQDGVARLVNTGDAATPDELEAILGVRELPITEVTPEALLEFNAPEVRALGVPGGGGVMRAADLALFYQALLHNPNDIWDPAVLADATGNVRNELPERWTGVTANRSLGLVIAGDDGRANLRGFGHTGSPRTFGHNGAGGQIAWADPDSGLSFAYVTNGMDQHVIRQGRRGIALSSLAALCS